MASIIDKQTCITLLADKDVVPADIPRCLAQLRDGNSLSEKDIQIAIMNSYFMKYSTAIREQFIEHLNNLGIKPIDDIDELLSDHLKHRLVDGGRRRRRTHQTRRKTNKRKSHRRKSRKN